MSFLRDLEKFHSTKVNVLVGMDDLLDKEFPSDVLWDYQIKKFKFNVKAVNFDLLGDGLEFFFLDSLIVDGDCVLDLGCGNGRTLIGLAKKMKNCNFYGVDFVEGMIDVANKEKKREGLGNVFFYHCDALSDDLLCLFDFKFDKVITKRLLINLKGEDKFVAVKNIHSLLKDSGTYILVECFIEPLSKINVIRKELGLEEIKVRFFNEYLSSDFFDGIKTFFLVKEKIDFFSSYYFISRVFNAYLSVGEPNYFSSINKLAVSLTKKGVNPIKGYAPEIIFLLKKKKTFV